MESGIGDLIRQIPIQYFLILIGSGLLYVIAMIIIFRRASRRRRARALAALGMTETFQPLAAAPPRTASLLNAPMNFLRGELPKQSSTPAAWTVPMELRGVPEPDLDMLATPASIPDNLYDMASYDMESSTTALTTTETSELDWLVTALVPQEELMPIKSASTSPDTGSSGAGGSMESAVEVMRVWRDVSDGSLIIQMGNQRYRSLSEIKNPDLTRRFTAVVRELWAMVNGPRAVNTLSRPHEALSDTSQQTPPIVGMRSKAATLLNADSEMSKAKFLTQQRGNTPAQPEAAPGIAGAVEEFLQNKLLMTPQFATRTIHIRPSPDHGLKIQVDNHFYDAIDEVVDPDVRDFLFSVMREWEARQ